MNASFDSRLRKATSDESGFGLVDAMVGLFILLVGLLSTAFVMSAVAGHQIDNTTRTMAVHLAEEKMEDIRNSSYAEVSDEVSDFGTLSEHLDFRRSVTVAVNEDDTMKTVDISVNHIGGESVTFSTRIAR